MSEWDKFTCRYRFDGSEWCLTIPARSMDEASRRLRAIGMTGVVQGRLIAEIPANIVTHFPLSTLVPLVCAVRNFFHRLFRRR